MSVFQKVKEIATGYGDYLSNLGLIVLIVLGLMNIVHHLTYLRPADGTTWEMVNGELTAVDVDLERELQIQVGDVLKGIDNEVITDIDNYLDRLHSVSKSDPHLYIVERSQGNRLEYWVTIYGVKDLSNREYYLFAISGFIYLIFLLLMQNQNVNFGSRRSFIAFCFFVFLKFVFTYTDSLTTLDWISLYLDTIGGVMLPSALVAVALNQSMPRSRWLPYVHAVHWIPSILLLILSLTGILEINGFTHLGLGADFFPTLELIQGLWGGSLICTAVLMLALVAEIRFKERNFSPFWGMAWLPFALMIWRLEYPFSTLLAALAPVVLPVALLVAWSRNGDLYLGEIAKKVIVYFSVVFVLFLGYFLFIESFEALLGSKISPGAQWIILGIGIMFASVSYSPLKHFAADLMDRLVYGKRLASIRRLSDFSEINRADTNIDEFLYIMLNRIRKAFLISQGHAYTVGENTRVFNTISASEDKHAIIFEERNPRLLQGAIIRGHEARAFVIDKDKKNPFGPNHYICPIRVSGRLVALIVFFLEGSDPKLSPEERRLLESLLHQCDVLMENMELYQAVHQKAESISQLKEYQENIIESSRIGILTTDEMGRTVAFNTALTDLAGIAKEEIMGKRFEEVFLHGKINSQRQVKAGFTMEGDFQNARKETLVLEIQKTPLRTKENDVYGTLYLVEDVFEKKKFNEKMMQQEKLASIGLLAAGVAHEINTPLTGITSYSQMLIGDGGLSEEHRELLLLIQGQSRRAANIVRELLNFSRKESEPKGPVDLLGVLNQTLRFLSHQIDKNGVEVIVAEPRRKPFIEGYQNQIQQVFVNLIVNAMDAMPDGGKIDIDIFCGKRYVEMRFQDTGIGMDPQTKTHIFDPFFTTKEVGKGTGLGLSVVYNILQGHGASVEVGSQSGRGCCFILSFPLKEVGWKPRSSTIHDPLPFFL